MPDAESRLLELVAMSRALGQPERGYAILGEGNTAARADADSFWVKASGFALDGIAEAGFVRVLIAPLMSAIEAELDDSGVASALRECKSEPESPRPSVETFLHAIAISEGGAEFVGHTHPVAVNRVLCSNMAEEAVRGRLFPDEVVNCGPRSLYLPYADPGLTLARAFRDGMHRFLGADREAPRVILIQNHGLIVLGSSPTEVLATTAMTVKAFEVLYGTYALGGPHFLESRQVERIQGRPDEAYRRWLISE